MDIAEFLEARWAEREAAANAATPGEWVALDGGVMSAEDDAQWPVSETETTRDRQNRVHIALNDPAAVLADIEAKRAILDHHKPVRHEGRTMCGSCLGAVTFWPCPTLQHFAAPFASHPDYDPSWRPQP